MFSDSKKQPHRLCLMVNYMPDDFQPPKLAPHGNSKSSKPYFPTTITAITTSSPKEILSDVSSSVGGVLAATDPCSLPRNEQQILDAKRRQKESGSMWKHFRC